jgi:hypothetical protein
MTDAELAIVVKLKDMFSKQLDSIVANTDKSAKKMESAWTKFSGSITAAKVAVAGWVTGQAARFIQSTVQMIAQVDRANTAFGAMSKRIGMDVTSAMNRMREASSGAASNLDLMASANKAIMLGAVKTGDELEKLVMYGTKLGNAMGLSAAQGIEYFTTGLARQSAAILDNVGLIVDLEGEYKRLGKTADQLTEDERRSIFSSVVWNKAAESVRALGTQTATAAVAADRLSASWDNMVSSLLSIASGPAATVLDTLADFLQDRVGIVSLKERLAKSERSIEGQYSGEAQQLAGTINPYVAPNVSGLSLEELVAKEQERARIRGGTKIGSAIAKGNAAAAATKERGMAWAAAQDAAAGMYSETNENAIVQRESAFLQRLSAVWADMVAQSQRVWDAMGEGVKEYYAMVSNTMLNVKSTVIRGFQDLEVTLGDVFFDMMMGKMKSFKDYLRAFVQDIGRTISQLMARQAVAQIIAAGGAAFGSVFGGSSTSGDIDTRLGPKDMGGNIDLAAAGGITSGLTLAGEAGPEAVVPLPGSRSIPVQFTGGGRGGNVTYIINAIDTQSFAAALAGNKATIHRMVTEGLGADTQLRAAVRAV